MKILNSIFKIIGFNNKKLPYYPYSFSKIDLWKRCPFKFKLKYIKNVKIPFAPNLALLKGSFLHHCIENNSEGKKYQTTEIFTEKEKTKTVQILNKFTKSELYQLYLSAKGEHEIGFGISKVNDIFKAVSFNNPNALFKGKIDYIFQKNNVLYIVDWKSGKYIEKEEQNFSQLLLYTIWGFLKYKNINTINCSFVYVEHLKENSVQYQRYNLDIYIENYIQDINKIESDKLFNKIESKQCEYCEYRKFGYCIGEE